MRDQGVAELFRIGGATHSAFVAPWYVNLAYPPLGVKTPKYRKQEGNGRMMRHRCPFAYSDF